MNSLVMKFGGTSVGDAAAMHAAGALVIEALPRAPVVVLSAMTKVTDALLTLARTTQSGDSETATNLAHRLIERHRQTAAELFDGATPPAVHDALTALFVELDTLLGEVAAARVPFRQSCDAIAALGERASTLLFAHWLLANGVPARWLDVREIMVTDDEFGQARPDEGALAARARELLLPHCGAGRAVVTQGYIGRSPGGATTTLGRGGSDYSAALIGAAIGSAEIQIWTDVEGVLSADPRLVEHARPIAALSAAEAAELAAFGAKVLHPATIAPAVAAGIPVTVRHTRRPQGRFTSITATAASGRSVAAVATRGPISVLTVRSPRMLQQSGFLARLFEVFARHRVPVDLVSTAEVSVSLTVEQDAPLHTLRAEIAEFATLDVAEQRAIVAVVGERLKRTRSVCARAFAAIQDLPIELISLGANEINLSIVVPQPLAHECVRRLHAALIETEVTA